MRIGKKSLLAAPLAVVAMSVCILLSTPAHAIRVIIIGGSAGTQNGMTVCDCTQTASGCGCIVPAPK